MTDQFRALVARQIDGVQKIAIETLGDADLPAADVTVRVEYSSFNYKDGLALKGKNRILRSYPIIPGIDFAGTVLQSTSAAFRPGERVVLTGWGVGEGWSGGFAERARVKGDWLVKLPSTLSTRQAMMIGTAGLTAMLSVLALERHGLKPGAKIVVSGASGGVGSVAIRLLAKRGYTVAALTGRPEEERYLRSLGASEIVGRTEFQAPGKPLAAERWDGAVDSVGGAVLANILASIRYGGAVAACGLAGGSDLPTTVFPFILRNVALLGVDSVQCPKAAREAAWRELANELGGDSEELDLATEINLEGLETLAGEIVAGKVRGRTIVKL
ncbi:MAG: acryloyl-CoA reductase [Rhodospirillales bacterium]|nr:acryloyl-CoA reductase [Rhodospirillales bacterium]